MLERVAIVCDGVEQDLGEEVLGDPAYAGPAVEGPAGAGPALHLLTAITHHCHCCIAHLQPSTHQYKVFH